MKNVLQKILFCFCVMIAFSCSKIESVIEVKNPNQAPLSPKEKAPELPPITTTTTEVALVESELLVTPFGSQVILNKIEKATSKGNARISKKYTFKTAQKISLNFKGSENISQSQCDPVGKPEVTAVLKIGNQETSAKYSDLVVTELNPNQELSLTISIDNSLNCELLLFEFAVVAREFKEAPVVSPTPIVLELMTIEVKEFLSAGTFGACVDLACLTRELRTSTTKIQNPKNKMEEITEDRFVLAPSLELICQNRRLILDNSGITDSTCKLTVNPALATPEIKIYRGADKKANLIQVEITTPALLEKLCNKWPNINSDERVEVFANDTEKNEIPRLELTCTYDKDLKVTSASFVGVLN